MKELLTAQECAARLRLTAETIRRMVDRGELPGFRAGKCYRIPKEAVDKLVSAADQSDDVSERP